MASRRRSLGLVVSALGGAAVLASIVVGAQARVGSFRAADRATGRNGPIAYEVLDGDHFGVVVVDSLGYGSRPLLDDPQFDEAEPAYSPDGEWLAFSRGPGGCVKADPQDAACTVGVAVAHADGSGMKVIVGAAGMLAWWATPVPAWSPDGSRIVFACACVN